MTQELDPQALIDSYGMSATVRLGDGKDMTLEQALEAERLFCPADSTDRNDPTKRLGYLANMLAAAGTLRPEHEHLVTRTE
jgi:hypothetical protein